jgi:acetylornithine aminotransferase
VGRTGAWFAHTATGVTPDIVTLAKGLAGGIPIGVCVAVGEYGELLQPGHHGTTFGGNPVAAAAGLAVIETIEREGLLENVRKVSDLLAAGLTDPRVTEIRAAGLLIGIDLAEPVAGKVAAAALAHGFILNDCAPARIRLVPPLVLTEEQAGELLDAWPTILDEAFADGEAP